MILRNAGSAQGAPDVVGGVTYKTTFPSKTNLTNIEEARHHVILDYSSAKERPISSVFWLTAYQSRRANKYSSIDSRSDSKRGKETDGDRKATPYSTESQAACSIASSGISRAVQNERVNSRSHSLFLVLPYICTTRSRNQVYRLDTP